PSPGTGPKRTGPPQWAQNLMTAGPRPRRGAVSGRCPRPAASVVLGLRLLDQDHALEGLGVGEPLGRSGLGAALADQAEDAIRIAELAAVLAERGELGLERVGDVDPGVRLTGVAQVHLGGLVGGE